MISTHRFSARSKSNLAFCGFRLLSSTAYAQSQTGSLSGLVVDTTGASVQDATVEARKSDTGLTLATKTTQDGLYVFPAVPTGTWSVSVEKQGFRRVLQEGIEIFIAQRQTINVTLQIGDAKQTETDVGNIAPRSLNQRRATSSRTFLQTLPLWSARSAEFGAFLSYMPGVNNGGETSIAGSTGRARESLIDGTSNVIPESGGTVFNPPSAESFEEFKLLTGNLFRRIRAHRRRHRNLHDQIRNKRYSRHLDLQHAP